MNVVHSENSRTVLKGELEKQSYFMSRKQMKLIIIKKQIHDCRG